MVGPWGPASGGWAEQDTEDKELGPRGMACSDQSFSPEDSGGAQTIHVTGQSMWTPACTLTSAAGDAIATVVIIFNCGKKHTT